MRVALGDGAEVAASLSDWLGTLTLRDLSAQQLTGQLIDAVVAWATGRGWRAYRRAASVVRLPPPLDHQHSVLDVACARPAAPPVVVEVDHTDRRRTLNKLVAEAEAGRVPIWVRWGTGRFLVPPEPISLVPFEVTRRTGRSGQGALFSRVPAYDRPPPAHSALLAESLETVALPIPIPSADPR